MDYELINLTITGVLMVAALSLYVAMSEKKRRGERAEAEVLALARKKRVRLQMKPRAEPCKYWGRPDWG